MEKTSGSIAFSPHAREQQDAVFSSQPVVAMDMGVLPQSSDGGHKAHRQAEDSLFQVIKKLSKIVEKRPRRCSLSGRKRPHLLCGPVTVQGTPLKKAKHPEESGACSDGQLEGCRLGGAQESTVTIYQCSLCKFSSLTLAFLKDHLHLHNQPNSNAFLACSKCNFTTHQRGELDAHVELHLDSEYARIDPVVEYPSDMGKELEYIGEGMDSTQAGTEIKNAKVSLDTVASKPTKQWYSQEQCGMYRCLICSYVCGQQRMLKTHAWKHAGLVDCSYPIFEDRPEASSGLGVAAHSVPEEAVLVLTAVGSKLEAPNVAPAFQLKLCAMEAPSKEELASEGIPTVVAEEPAVEIQVTMETHREKEWDPPDSKNLLSSAPEFIDSSPNVTDNGSVIVENLPEVRELPASKPFPVNSDMDINKKPLDKRADMEAQDEEEDSDVPVTDDSVSPSRVRTQAESLRLHSLAAEVLVAMPSRTHEHASGNSRGETEPDAKVHSEGHNPAQEKSSTCTMESNSDTLADSDQKSQCKQGVAKGLVKSGISLSLLTVIEKLRERTNENISDEDILRELQNDIRNSSRNRREADLSTGGTVKLHPGNKRPYRCQLCHYANSNDGFAKQHLQAHRQGQPYQCPVCQHVAHDSKDLEKHMIHHCTSKMQNCKQCSEAFHSKSPMRNHEKEQHGSGGNTHTVTETMVTTTVEEASQATEVYQCDVCDYTSSTYIGVRNHRRIHNSEKPYRCCSCDFTTTTMNSLRNHMRRHPLENQTVQLLEQYRCSLCGYMCSHPPSLKSHMWKHAGDQNYNYEQVNRAIDEAISQSSRSLVAPQSSVPGVTPFEWAKDSTGKAMPDWDLSGRTARVDQAPLSQASGEARGRSTLGPEYCVLLFCCCICGFESPSKEQLLEHMKDHEGDILGIILSRGQQKAAPPAGH
ncbi:hypothetical protein AGOR_G00168170 [Albula goreensis]|uniref:C2H2-type domain-containing protein n=1 Tax=Albula goreensis TaxID=1534307 RepID=A0A8T3D5N8_9TELE|nr:hypothetical protein AGOR_G00168170 [Albula goreensis]